MGQYLKKSLLVLTLVLIAVNALYAQDTNPVFEPHKQVYISVGAGSSFMSGLPSDIYSDGNSNLQLGAMYERAFHPRFSLILGLEFEQLAYNFDGDVRFTSPSTVDVVRAGTDKKYTGIRQRSLAFPVQLRTYLHENLDNNGRNMFVQGGVRLVQTLDFTGVDGLRSLYFFRSEDETDGIHLSDFANQSLLQLELMIGFKGQFFEKFDLLNASSLGFMYQLTPMLNEGSTKISPLHFTWRFLF